MNRPVHFEIQSPDPEAAILYFETTLGWQFSRWEGDATEYWVIRTGEGLGIDGGLLRSPDGQSRSNVVMQVADVDAAAAAVVANGGEIVVPRMEIPGVGSTVYAKDPTGNIYGMIQFAQRPE